MTDSPPAYVLRSLPAGLIITDEQERIVFCNPLADRIRGVGQRVGRSVAECHPERSRKALGKVFDRFRSTDEARQHPLVIERANGWRVQYARIGSPEGEFRGVVWMAQDVRRQKVLEEQLVHQEKLSGLGRMAAKLAHEVKNPSGFAMKRPRPPVVLVVEDEPVAVRVMSVALEREGFVVHAASEGSVALSMLPEIQPDVIVVDYPLPGMSGMDVLRYLHRRAPDVPVVMITGHGDERLAVEAMKIGAFTYLPKPLDYEELGLVLGRAVELRRLRRDLRDTRLSTAAGPVFCSWVCPWGLLSEMIDKVKQKLRPRPWHGRRWVKLRAPRATLLGVLFALGALAGIPIVAILSAPRLITTLPAELLYLRMLSLTTGGLLLLLLIFELVGPRRLWCRALCPVGTFANLVRSRKTLLIRHDAERCLHETPAACHAGCPWGLDPRQIERFDGCSNCMVCVEGCPGTALHPGFGR